MGKTFLFLFVLAGAAVLNPDVRERVKPYIQFALDPVYTWTARSRVAEVTRSLEAGVAAGRSVPRSDKELHPLLREAGSTDDGHLDPWGRPYFVKMEFAAVRVGSAGPDGRPGTADDILGKALPAPRR